MKVVELQKQFVPEKGRNKTKEALYKKFIKIQNSSKTKI